MAESGAGVIGSLIPLILMGCLFGWFLSVIAKRKDRSRLRYFLISFIPMAWFPAGLWLASLPDKAILDKLEALEVKLVNTSNGL